MPINQVTQEITPKSPTASESQPQTAIAVATVEKPVVPATAPTAEPSRFEPKQQSRFPGVKSIPEAKQPVEAKVEQKTL